MLLRRTLLVCMVGVMWGCQAPSLHALLAAKGPHNLAGALGRGADPNERNEFLQTPLHVAVEIDDQAAVAALLRAGADVEAVDDAGATPLHEAARRCRLGIVRQLVAQGANANHRNSLEDYSCLDIAAFSGAEPALVRLLVAAGAEVSAPHPRTGNTPLHYVAMGNHWLTARELVAAGARIDAGNLDGDTPIDMAISHDAVHVRWFLWDCGARPTPRSGGKQLQK